MHNLAGGYSTEQNENFLFNVTHISQSSDDVMRNHLKKFLLGQAFTPPPCPYLCVSSLHE